MSNHTVYQMGRCRFRLKLEDQGLLRRLCELLPAEEVSDNSTVHLIDLDDFLSVARLQVDYEPLEDAYNCMNYLIGQVIAKHEGCLWIDAAVLQTPDRKLVMLSGPSCAGKTTLTLAMTRFPGWKAIAEDITLIDPATGQVIPLPRASSIRPGCAELLSLATGWQMPERTDPTWYFESQMFVTDLLPAKFDWLIELDVIEPDRQERLHLESLGQMESLRFLLQISNALRSDNGVDVLSGTIAGAQCLRMSGGSLSERISALKNVCGTAQRSMT